ncbi:phosphoribosylamine--glycine ligase [bacterium BMS3Abin07]|nr:phosphoribosylamine--glycine ligase [bacterium BMS3Abin07]GBE31666.1 phosphoribosylamine--glycine ligase [bacterium BMS3Bbin05]
MKVLVIGNGGREHAICWKLVQSRQVDQVFCCRGNAGISEVAECVDIDMNDFGSLINFVKYEWIDMTIVGPEAPLSRGIVDAFEKEGRRIMGPVRAAARLESSKVFSKDFMRKFNIPTAGYKVFSSYNQAEDYVRMKGSPIVIKADGLAAGKGVIVAGTVDDAISGIRHIMKDRAFGDAGNRVVIEDCLFGEEVSYMVFTDGDTILPMVSSQDHKRIYDNDRGPNTGGMGAYSPAPVVTPEIEKQIMNTVMLPVINGMKKEGIKYKGILYAGLMIRDGNPYVLEFNCRLGDPETQPVLMRMDSDLMNIAFGITDGRLSETELKWKDEAAVCIVIASNGYPGKYDKGRIITGMEDLKKEKDVIVFHAGTSFNEEDKVITSGGRVLGVTALGKDLKEAKEKAYKSVNRIHFEGMHFRKDIADKALNR